jgi:Asp-tRNA(Asn)/Glu-tRNA(Gln) amidotransferase A subunit family amidase
MSTPTVASESTSGLDRRSFMAYFSAVGLAGTAFPAALWARAQGQARITREMLPEAEAVAGVQFTEEERELMLRGLNQNLRSYERIRSVPIPNSVPPALRFRAPPPPAASIVGSPAGPVAVTRPEGLRVPADLEDAAFWPVTHLAELIRSRQVTSEALTRMYLGRLKRFGFQPLEAVVTLTEELALEQARRADRELAAGRYRGPLHGIPWGAKDLLAVRGHPTTWGAAAYREQVFDEDATVVTRLEEAGAVLLGKLTLGELAWGEVWFGGMTRNPWNLEQGSSGSSAGSAAATAAGLVGFAIGSETLGSIVSPATRTGTTGLRPTYGRVSRHGAMALSWSMDKLGPLCRSAEDCALVLAAINGPDGHDDTVRDVPFHWDPARPLRDLRVGYLQSAFASDRPTKHFDDAVLAVVRSLGVDPVPVELPGELPIDALGIILSVEAAAAFDELTRSGGIRDMVRQGENTWPNTFRQARLIPAVEYLNANRIRTMLAEAMDRALDGIDVFVSPSYAPSLLMATNLTGHPTVVVPNGFTDAGTPVSISFVGNLWRDAEALLLARAYQEATDFHRRRPAGF